MQGSNNILAQDLKNLKLHFKALVTDDWHLSDKIILASYFIENSEPFFYNIAYTLYFQKILGFLNIGRPEILFYGGC